MNSESKKLENLEVAPENAEKMAEWIRSRGGVAVWRSVNFANLDASWSTPALTVEGAQMTKPTWEADSKPVRVITDPAEIDVVTRREVKRIKVSVRRGRGLLVDLTDASAKRLRKAVHDATFSLQKGTGLIGPGASYHFDYETREAVITVRGEVVSLTSFVK